MRMLEQFTIPESPSLKVLVRHYNNILSTTLNQVAPLRNMCFDLHASCPLVHEYSILQRMKAAGCQLKCLNRKTSLTVHALVYKEHVTQYKEALKKAKTNYYSTVISNGLRNPRPLLRINCCDLIAVFF